MRCTVQGSRERYLGRSLRRSSLATIMKNHTRVLSTSLPTSLSSTMETSTMTRGTSLPSVMGDQDQEAREDLGLYDQGDEIQGEDIEVKESFEEESFIVLGKAVLKVPDMAEEDEGNADYVDEEDYEEDSDEFDDCDSDDSELYAEDSESDEECSDLREWREKEAARRRQEGLGMLEALEQEERRLKLEERERLEMEEEELRRRLEEQMDEEEELDLLGHPGDFEEEDDEEEEVVRVRNQFDALLDDSEEEEEDGEEEWRGTFRRVEVASLQQHLQAAHHDSSLEDSGLEDSGEEGERSSERERQARVLASGPQELWRHIQDYGLGLVSRPPTRSDGNCWYDAIADQVRLHEVPGVPREHAALRRFLVEAVPSLDQAPQWAETVFGGAEVFQEFLEVHSSPGQWTDELGIMCQATALIVGREIRLVGTANIGQLGPGYTVLESVPGAERLQPLTVGYYQDRHYQSLAEAAWPRADSGLGGELREALESTELRQLIGEQHLEEKQDEVDSKEELEELSTRLKLPSNLKLSRVSSSPLAHLSSPKPTNLSPLAHLSTSNPTNSSPFVHLASPKPRLSSSSSPLERLSIPLANPSPRGLLSNLMV